MLKKFFSLFLVFAIASCSFLNDKAVKVPFTSNPSGASVYIDGQYRGQTPTSIKLVPDKNYKATIVKRGYGSSNIDLESWYSVRGGRGGDNTRCVLDALGIMLVIPAFGFYSTNCRDFKKSEYNVNIGRNDFGSGEGVNLEYKDTRNNVRNYRQEGHNPYESNNPYGNNYGKRDNDSYYQGYGRGGY